MFFIGSFNIKRKANTRSFHTHFKEKYSKSRRIYQCTLTYTPTHCFFTPIYSDVNRESYRRLKRSVSSASSARQLYNCCCFCNWPCALCGKFYLFCVEMLWQLLEQSLYDELRGLEGPFLRCKTKIDEDCRLMLQSLCAWCVICNRYRFFADLRNSWKWRSTHSSPMFWLHLFSCQKFSLQFP